MKILLTGAAGFIGFHTAEVLLARGHDVLGLDSLNAYYDPALKRARLAQVNGRSRFRFVQVDIADEDALHGGSRKRKLRRHSASRRSGGRALRTTGPGRLYAVQSCRTPQYAGSGEDNERPCPFRL